MTSPYSNVLSAEIGGEKPAACGAECLWYEADGESGACLNRRSFVCVKHTRDVFGNPETESTDS